MCLSICLFLCYRKQAGFFLVLTGFFAWFTGKGFGKNGKNATKTGAEILPWAVKCPYMTEKILEFNNLLLRREREDVIIHTL